MQIELYCVFNSIDEKKQKILFVTTRMKNKIFSSIKLIMMHYLHNQGDSTRIFFNFDNFKREMRVIFEIINEIFTFKRIFQYFIQKISIVDYA